MTELGPPFYAMTGVDGQELTNRRSNRWEEAIQMKELVQELWEHLENEESGK